MNEVPIVGRTELWHPLFVHFPIALLILSTIVGLAYIIWKRSDFAANLKFAMSLLLWCGIAFFWITFYTGNLAYGIEVRKICDPTVLKDHLLWAYISGAIFSIAVFFDIIQKIWQTKTSRFLSIVTVSLMLIGSVCLGYDGHLGASLVYQQGAGVHKPASDCSDYE